MILNNTQANIFKVNGGIADNFANRPAANSSFYIFYSIDTQEIFYDNGAWVLIGSGGGGVNIYNSDGTLTGNRILSGANNDLNFADLNVFKTTLGGNDIGLKIDFANQQYYIGDIINTNSAALYVDGIQGYILGYESNVGSNGISVIPKFGNVTLGDFGAVGNQTILNIEDTSQIIKTQYQGNDTGLKLDFANQIYFFGDVQNSTITCEVGINRMYSTGINGDIYGFNFDFLNKIFDFGDTNQNGNSTLFSIDDSNQIIKTKNQTNDIGLKLDFANTNYQFGQLIGGNGTFLWIRDNINKIEARNGSVNDGLSLDYNNSRFDLGKISGGNLTKLIIEDNSENIYTTHSTGNNGIFLSFLSKQYLFGQINGGNKTLFVLNDTTQIIKTQNNNNDIGFKLDIANTNYQFGQITGGNTTYLTIDDAATYPVQIDGTNVIAATAGGASGNHLKIKINGVDYKIELRNP